MSIAEVLRMPAVEVFQAAIFEDEIDKLRRARAARRMDLYRGKSEARLREEFLRIYRFSPERRLKAEAFAFLGTALALFPRIVNEVAGPVYNPPPTRMFNSPAAQIAWEANAARIGIDRKMDMATRVGVATGSSHGFWRTSDRLGPVLDIISPDRLVVVPDPDNPLLELGVAYRRDVKEQGVWREHWVCWDADMAFELDHRGSIVALPLMKAGGHPGMIPMWSMHMVERIGTYWEASTAGADLEAAHTLIADLLTQTLRLHHVQGHAQIGISGDPARFPRGQVLDPDNPVFWGDGNQGSMLFNPQDPSGNLKTIDMVITTVAANYGVDRERLNANITAQATGLPLLERRAETLEVVDVAERRSIEIFAVVSRAAADPAMRMPVDMEIEEIAYPDLSSKTDREKQLRVREAERKEGVRSRVTSLLEDRPELKGDREAARKALEQMADDEAWFIEMQKQHGIRTDANVDEPGQTQEENGAMGPEVRDGKKTKDEAAEQAVVGRRGRVAQ